MKNLNFLSKWLVFCEQKSDWLMKKNKSLTLLFSKVQQEQFAHGCCFLKSNMSNLLTVAHFKEPQEQIAHSCPLKWLILSKWAKRKSAKSQRANSQPCQKPMRGTPLKVPIFKKWQGAKYKKTEYLLYTWTKSDLKTKCLIFLYFLKGKLKKCSQLS